MQIKQEVETKQTLTDIASKKLPYIWAICICLVLVYCSRNMLITLLNSVPRNIHDTFADFTLTYMKSGSHQVFFILGLILLIIVTMTLSTYLLIRSFEYQEKQGKLLNIILIVANIFAIITTVLSNVIIFKLIFMMILISLAIVFIFGAMGSSQNASKQHY